MPDPQVDYDALAAQHGGTPDYDALASEHGGTSSGGGSMNFAVVNGQRVPVDDGPLDLVAGAAHALNPLPAIQSVGQMVQHGLTAAGAAQIGQMDIAKRQGAAAMEPIHGILRAQTQVKDQADEAWKSGDTATAVRKYVDWLLPVIGPVLDQAADKMAHGQPWRGAGEAIGTALGLAGPKALETARIKVPAIASNRNPVEAAAVDFGRQQGVPIDAATATGNPFVRNVQKGTGMTPIGSIPAMRMHAAQADALENVGRDLAQQARGAASTPETAGATMGDALQSKIEAHAQYADHAYGTLEKIAADPKNTVTVQTGSNTVNTGVLDAQGNPITRTVPVVEKIAIPVDLRAVRAALKPIYTSIARSMSITQRQASAGFQAMENIVNGRDFEPLLQSERDLGALKEIARGSDLPELRNVSQGLGAQGVKRLQAAIDAAAAKAGPQALQALKDGRAATAEKFATADVRTQVVGANGLREPVAAYKTVTAAQDAGIDQLRAIAKQTPTTIPQIARAWIDQQLTKATTEGSFQRAQRLQNTWNELGTETKKILFPQKGQTQALDNYFRLARIIAENPNPSGTAMTNASMASLAGLLYPPTMIPTAAGIASAGGISALLNSPKAVALFTKGTTLMLGPGKASKAAMSMGIADVIRAAREAGITGQTTVPVPGQVDPTRPQDQ